MVDILKDEQCEYFIVRRMVLDGVQDFLGTELCSLALNPVILLCRNVMQCVALISAGKAWVGSVDSEKLKGLCYLISILAARTGRVDDSYYANSAFPLNML